MSSSVLSGYNLAYGSPAGNNRSASLFNNYRFNNVVMNNTNVNVDINNKSNRNGSNSLLQNGYIQQFYNGPTVIEIASRYRTRVR